MAFSGRNTDFNPFDVWANTCRSVLLPEMSAQAEELDSDGEQRSEEAFPFLVLLTGVGDLV